VVGSSQTQPMLISELQISASTNKPKKIRLLPFYYWTNNHPPDTIRVIHMLNFKSLLIFSEDPKKLSDFYQKVFQEKPMWEDGGYTGFKVGDGMIMIGPHDKVHGASKNPERLIFNFITTDVEKEFKRIEKLGAVIIAKPYNPGESDNMLLATLADPDGNYFQLATPME
jgi:predicted enzyme related to lactoylglutathione lyase